MLTKLTAVILNSSAVTVVNGNKGDVKLLYNNSDGVVHGKNDDPNSSFIVIV